MNHDAGCGYCPRCGEPITVLMPVEPVFSLETVAVLIPAGLRQLRKLLLAHKGQLGEPVYRRTANARYWRMLTASDVRYLRSQVLLTRTARQQRAAVLRAVTEARSS